MTSLPSQQTLTTTQQSLTKLRADHALCSEERTALARALQTIEEEISARKALELTRRALEQENTMIVLAGERLAERVKDAEISVMEITTRLESAVMAETNTATALQASQSACGVLAE